MAELRVGRGWSSSEMKERLERLPSVPSSAPEGWPEGPGWHAERHESLIARERPGRPLADGFFARAREALKGYELSDPSIVIGHFVPGELDGRRMLLEIRVLGLHYLCGVLVSEVREDDDGRTSTFGFRYETLEGHIERGAEWFVIEKDHDSGDVCFRIFSTWRAGDFPNWWSHVGFTALAPYYRGVWLRRAHERLRALLREPVSSLRRSGDEVVHEDTATEDLPIPDPDLQPHLAVQASLASLALGALTGLRSLSAPMVLALRSLRTGPRPGASVVERALAVPSASLWLGSAAILEAIADKHPRTPARVTPLPLLGRVITGALAGFIVSKRWRTKAPLSVAVGALAAGGAATLGYAARTSLARRRPKGAVLFGLLEDALVVAGAAALTRAMDRAAPQTLVPVADR